MAKQRILVGVLSLSFISGITAQDYQPQSLELSRGWQLQPQLEMELGFDDNTAHSHSNTTNSWFWRVSPELLLHRGDDIERYELMYQFFDGHYFSSSADNYQDHLLKFDAKHQFTRRHRLHFSYLYERGHQARGLGVTAGNGDNPLVDRVTKFDLHDINLVYGFGLPSARMNLDFGLGYYDKDYRNLRLFTVGRSYDRLSARTTAYWRLHPTLSGLLEWQGQDQDFSGLDNEGFRRDFVGHKWLTGLRWDPTAKTSGRLKLGYEALDFADNQRPDFSGLAWSIGLDWQWRSYSLVTLEGGSRVKDPNTQGGFVEENRIDIRWQHQWRQDVETLLATGYRSERVSNFAGDNGRDDDLWHGFIGVNLNWATWLRSELGYTFTNQSSNDEAFDYDKNLLSVVMHLAL